MTLIVVAGIMVALVALGGLIRTGSAHLRLMKQQPKDDSRYSNGNEAMLTSSYIRIAMWGALFLVGASAALYPVL